MTEPLPHTKFKHKEDNYIVIVRTPSGGIKVKDSNDATWQVGIAYIREDAPDGAKYIRPLSDFNKKFEEA